ncbi:MAG: hypothetical protein P4L84_17555, partial [Isosphaeraceae bacterium]|nr:hypothetical protein [Isosphaeraceae bacterium]
MGRVMHNVLAVNNPVHRVRFRPTGFGIALALFAALLVVITAMSTLDPDNNDIASNVAGLPIRAGVSAILLSGILGFSAVLLYRVSAAAGWLILIATAASALSDYDLGRVGNGHIDVTRWPPTVLGAAGVLVLWVCFGGLTTMFAAMYAAERRRRLGRWVVPVAAILVLSMVGGVYILALAYLDLVDRGWPSDPSVVPASWWSWWQPLLLPGWQLVLLVLLGLLGDLVPAVRRARARRAL